MEDALHRWLEASASIRSDLILLIGALFSALVTIHVLLNKRQAAAAIAWIGLAWLSPIFGSALYAMLGVNRVSRRAQRLRPKPSQVVDETPQAAAAVPEQFQPLDRAVGAITQLPTVDGTAITMLRNGDEAYPAMLAAIGQARTSVALSTYIFRDDAIGLAFCEALAAAQARGAKVCVLIDGIGSGYFFPAAWRRLKRAGVAADLFMHSALPWRMPFLNLRNHKKLLILDGRLAFTGGINIAQANLVATDPPNPIRDTHFRIEGPIVEQLTQAFASDWAFVTGEDLEGAAWFPAVPPAGAITARVVTSGPDADIEKIATVILQAIATARHSIRLTTPYFLPSEPIVGALSLAAQRGIRVDVIVPSVSDHRLVDWAMRGHVGALIESGVRIWLNAPPFDHSKALVVDRMWSFIGSANWDARSFRLNFELNLEVYDRGFSERLDDVMSAKMETPLTQAYLDARGLPERLRDAAVRLLLPYL